MFLDRSVDGFVGMRAGVFLKHGINKREGSTTWTAGATPDDTLVSAGLLRAVSSKYTTSADGATLTPVVGSSCP